MKHLSVLLFLIFFQTQLWADDSNLAHSAGGLKEAYTGEQASKPANELPSELEGVGITEQIGKSVDLSLIVTDEDGTKKPLSTFFHKHKPVIMSPVYFNCPGLCNFHLNGLVDTLKTIDWSPVKEFEIIALSFDWNEDKIPDVAAKKKQNYLKIYGRPETADGWHFLTADETTVKKITDSVGFKYKWNETAQEWSHASAAIILSPEGKISRYLHGIQFESRDVKLALNEAAEGKVGNLVDSVMLYCFKYNTHQSKYGLQVFNVMKLGGAVTAIILLLWLVPVLIRARRENV